MYEKLFFKRKRRKLFQASFNFIVQLNLKLMT